MGMFLAKMSSDSYQLLGMIELGMLPNFFAKRSCYGTPLISILFSASGVVLLSCLRFQEIVVAENFMNCFRMFLELLSFLMLTIKYPATSRPYRIPLLTLVEYIRRKQHDFQSASLSPTSHSSQPDVASFPPTSHSSQPDVGPLKSNSLPPTFPPQPTSLPSVAPTQQHALPPAITPMSTSLPSSFPPLSSSLLPSSTQAVSLASSTPSISRSNIGVHVPTSPSMISSTTTPACSKAQNAGDIREYDAFHRLIITPDVDE
ncbi:hypothetical protein H5410_027886 [Solanum commersonii]|uniref:Uncharacterized protein n=1 Tax=Solanum commersonii TaxID=4109 RepID=A0A9J5Z139_SOLCO|nr:hypothetical protein H5410_027886 [Solanum commersonii]